MADRYVNIESTDQRTHFEQAVAQLPERSRMTAQPRVITTFDAGRLVPIYCREVLPSQTIKLDLDFTLREVTMKTPVLGALQADVYAFYVANRNVNSSWQEVMGENKTGFWAPASETVLAPLTLQTSSFVSFPVGSIADYYGIPTQQSISSVLLNQMNDLKLRGYFSIWNEYFRDQNYQAPLAVPTSNQTIAGFLNLSSSINVFQKPLKVNKLHDYFTSVLPSPQKGESVQVPLGGLAPIYSLNNAVPVRADSTAVMLGENNTAGQYYPAITSDGALFTVNTNGGLNIASGEVPDISASGTGVVFRNLYADLSDVPAVSVADLRLASATQRYFEQLSRVGSRYREYLAGFFGVDVDNPMRDVPTYLGHIRRELGVYQTAQTSSSDSESPQGNLAAFSYTNAGGSLFQNGTFTAVEHGYLHVFVVVRHRNVYSSYLSRDWFRSSKLDFYQPQLANLSEQPVYTREINPFLLPDQLDSVFGYQEAWAEYRDEPDQVSGMMRPQSDEPEMASQSLAQWNYADPFSNTLLVANADFMESNTDEVVERTVAVDTSLSHQFFGLFQFTVDKELPMPVYSIGELE